MARTDRRDWLVEADDPFAGVHQRMGGMLPGPILAPGLLELVRRCRLTSMDTARTIQAQDDGESFSAWAEVRFDAASGGCSIRLSNWRASPLRDPSGHEAMENRAAVARHLAELSAWLGPKQEILAVEARAEDLEPVAARMREGFGLTWTDFVEIEGNAHEQPLHWRLMDGASLRVDGSERKWKAHLIPLGRHGGGHRGFELHLVADEPCEVEDAAGQEAIPADTMSAVGREIEPVLRKPISRIIANAEAIHSQLAGPLSEEYGSYAADIAAAGEHLLTLIQDLADLEVIEGEQFATVPERIDLSEIARRAAAFLDGRAQERGIAVEIPAEGLPVPAIGESRRVLQILLNLLGNAIRYAPANSRVVLDVVTSDGRALASVEDKGEGLSPEEQTKAFGKFERLGRSGDGGSGLGLYISRHLARAMNGDLTVKSQKGEGARFTLELPADEAAGN